MLYVSDFSKYFNCFLYQISNFYQREMSLHVKTLYFPLALIGLPWNFSLKQKQVIKILYIGTRTVPSKKAKECGPQINSANRKSANLRTWIICEICDLPQICQFFVIADLKLPQAHILFLLTIIAFATLISNLYIKTVYKDDC